LPHVVTVNKLRFLYGDHLALDGVGFNVAPGESFGLLGPNGSGKTTCFRILTTLLAPAGGTASICGHDVVNERDSVRASIGVVFQSPSLDPHLTTVENLRHGGHLYGLTARMLEDRIGEVLAALHVADRAKDLVKTLSGGLQRRVEMAKCLLHRPSVLILDEPSTGLDPRARKELWDYLKLLQRDHGMTLLLTTHYMEEAERCDRLALFDRGRLVICGSPDDLKRRVGGDCVTIECADPPGLNDRIARELNCKAAVLNGAVRIETDSGPSIVTDVMNRFGDEIRSVTFGRPTLEDVFVHETGRRFEEASPSEESSDDE